MVASCTWEKRPSITQPLKSRAGEVRGGWGRLGEVPPLPFTDLHRPPPTFGAVAASIPMAKPSRLHPARRRGIPVALTRWSRLGFAMGRLRAREGPECRAHQRGHAAALRQQRTGRLEPATEAHARRTDWLASPAAETAVEVQGDAGIGRSELARLERAHQLDAAARAVGFVTGSEEGGARLETEAAMHTGIQPFDAAPIRRPVPSTPTTHPSPGSSVRRSPATSGPTPSR